MFQAAEQNPAAHPPAAELPRTAASAASDDATQSPRDRNATMFREMQAEPRQRRVHLMSSQGSSQACW